MIKIDSISKSYNNVLALDQVSFQVNKNELFGLIGPDGAGKTTLFRILTTLLLADSGTAIMDNLDTRKDYKEIRNHIGYMPGRFSLYQDLSVEENLNFFATVFDTSIDENYDLIEDIYKQIEPFKKRLAGNLSGGMKQKLALSCALIHKPKILILDEPTTGVDAVSRMEFWQMLKRLQEKDITILVSTPYMDEASLCDRVALIQNAKILTINTPKNITKKFPKKLLAINTDNKYKLIKDLNAYENSGTVYPFGEYIHYTAKDNNPNVQDLTTYLGKAGNKNINIFETEANIEDCFMELMNTEQVLMSKK